MEDCSRSMNPWVLHLQKLGLELKCPLCLKFLSGPLLLPCDHIFCDSCVPRSSKFDPQCPVCKSRYASSGLRSLSFMEGIVSIYRNLDAAFTANLMQLQSSKEGGHKNNLSNGCTTQKEDKEVLDRNGVDPTGAQNLDFPPPSSQESYPRSNYQNKQVEMNQAEESLPDSPPLFGVSKCLDNDTSDHSPESSTRKLAKNSVGCAKRVHDGYASETIANQLRDSKRQKKLMYGSSDTYPIDDCTIKSVGPMNRSSVSSGLGSEPKPPMIVHSSLKLAATSEESPVNKTTCGFCQSSRISETTGGMLHYSKGKPVEGDDVFRSNVIHVHSSCIEWAPQVYYEGDSVKNLKPELARGAKIKCTKCGLKGAALGCYVNSCRRSYHVPCAREILSCRWDYDDFLLLCPVHSSVRFPNERSRARIVKEPILSGQTASLQPNEAKKWVLCGSALSSEEKSLVAKFASKIGATVSKFWRPDVTHVIAATDERGACTRTLKVLMGILNGKWILRTDWVKASLESNLPIDEEPFEVSHDNHGCHDGPKAGRLRVLENAPKLFKGLRFYFFGEFVRGYKEDLQSLTAIAGGMVLRTKDEMVMARSSGDQIDPKTIVVYNIDPPQGCALGEEVSAIWERLSQAEDLAAQTQARVVGHTWVLGSIAAYKLQPLIS